MQIIYGFVFYFTQVFAILTFCLTLMAIRGVRKHFYGVAHHMKIYENPIAQYLIYISFAIIGIIMLDSIWTFLSLNEDMTFGNNLVLSDYDSIQRESQADLLTTFKRQREFYLAQRNIMLAFSAFIIYFMFHTFVKTFDKLNTIENENDIQKSKKLSEVKPETTRGQ